MDSVFSEEILADKLSKLNGTQQCIESILLFLVFWINEFLQLYFSSLYMPNIICKQEIGHYIENSVTSQEKFCLPSILSAVIELILILIVLSYVCFEFLDLFQSHCLMYLRSDFDSFSFGISTSMFIKLEKWF